MKVTHKNKIVVDSMTFVQIKCDLYRVYNAQGFYCGIASDIYGTIIT